MTMTTILSKLRELLHYITNHFYPQTSITNEDVTSNIVVGSSGSAGIDLPAYEDVIINPREKTMIKHLVKTISSKDVAFLVLGRSSGNKHPSLIIQPGLIDSDYRGYIHTSVLNITDDEVKINAGTRLSQLLAVKIVQPTQMKLEGIEIIDRERGTSWLGSSDKYLKTDKSS